MDSGQKFDPEKLATLVIVINSLYNFVSSCRLEHDGQVLHFADSNISPLYLNMLYIRPSWRQLHDRIMNNLELGKKRILVSGSPGIGKSQFMLYCMWRAIQSGVQSFLYQQESGVVERHSHNSITHADPFDRWRNIHYGIPFFADITDLSEPLPGMVDSSAYTIICSPSDHPSRYNHFLKARGSITYIPEPWSKYEIDKAWELIPTFKLVPKELVNSQFKLYGGVPRYVFDKPDEGDVAMHRAILTKGREAAIALRTISLSSEEDSDMACTVVHMYIGHSDNGDKCSDKVALLPASPTVARVLTELYPRHMRNKL